MSHDDLEMRFWGNCSNTLAEELKQLIYLDRMGFVRKPTWRSQYSFDAEGKSFIDIGGGPASVLLKFENLRKGIVVDPGVYPDWVHNRYAEAAIDYDRVTGERWSDAGRSGFAVALIYNCLQHVEAPEQVIKRAICAVGSSGLRMFEWIDIPPHEGHPHMLTAEKLDEWTGRRGTVETFTGQNECYGKAWYLGAP